VTCVKRTGGVGEGVRRGGGEGGVGRGGGDLSGVG